VDEAIRGNWQEPEEILKQEEIKEQQQTEIDLPTPE
jgi:hypothetical protein